jgi:hypothetical protein
MKNYRVRIRVRVWIEYLLFIRKYGMYWVKVRKRGRIVRSRC